ncbi:PTS mannitol transporter subunit IIA [Orenia metallireducens]|jgi:PTS system mannitol-specific IIA component|uniref:Mannitol-specific phosphotransferase enzyme IIA component n=1 Tax=Orenia metallireducens TaxID=1413210 RepID=A0A1C0ABP6_9FIRM|nr:PTS sugar transporter subunit IIA [Orenia metallireducens]OCL27776.1 PTS mannitol transporter subunit IIA [Orenia metallireducens]
MGIFGLFNKKKENDVKEESAILSKEAIILGAESVDKAKAIEMAGQLLVDGGYVSPEYIAGMKEREEKVTTYIGNGVAIPHGTSEAKEYIVKSGISFIQFPQGVDFGTGEMCYLVIGIAGKGDDHIQILQNLATICQKEEEVQKLSSTNDKDFILSKLV